MPDRTSSTRAGPDAGGGNPLVDFRGQRRTNVTHQSTTDPDARLYRKSDGRPAQLAYGGHLVMENRSGLIVDARVTRPMATANGTRPS